MGHGKNNIIHKNHFRKQWDRRVRTWFDQPGQKKSRREARKAKADKAGVRPVKLLRPAVRAPTARYNRKLRAGRGFTLEEVKAAGLTIDGAKQIGIPVDHRRKNHSEESLKLNTARLEAYKARVVLFPRNKKQPKKGDSTGADLETKNFVQNAEVAFPIPASSTHEAPRAITEEERNFDAFRALRMARANERQVGPRKIRAQKAAEAAEAAKK